MNRIQNGTRNSKPTGNWYIINYSKHCFLHIIFKQQSFHIDACQETHIHQCRYEEDIFISLIETCLFLIYFKETYIFKQILFILFISSSLTRRVSCLCKLQPSSQKVNATFTCQGLMQTFFPRSRYAPKLIFSFKFKYFSSIFKFSKHLTAVASSWDKIVIWLPSHSTRCYCSVRN